MTDDTVSLRGTTSALVRWFGVAMAGLSVITMIFFIPAYPFWALAIIAVVALCGAARLRQARERDRRIDPQRTDWP